MTLQSLFAFPQVQDWNVGVIIKANSKHSKPVSSHVSAYQRKTELTLKGDTILSASLSWVIFSNGCRPSYIWPAPAWPGFNVSSQYKNAAVSRSGKAAVFFLFFFLFIGALQALCCDDALQVRLQIQCRWLSRWIVQLGGSRSYQAATHDVTRGL